jgi:hypothetical protein
VGVIPKLDPPAFKFVTVEGEVPSLITVSNGTAAIDAPQWLHQLHAAGLGPQAIRDLAEALAIEEELTADMVSYRKNVTGVDNTVFISAKFPQRGPRIKVATDPPTHVDPTGDNAVVSIIDGRILQGSLPPKVNKQVQEFLRLNLDALLDYWEKRIDTDELGSRLQSI